jgi:hypothetical protein
VENQLQVIELSADSDVPHHSFRVPAVREPINILNRREITSVQYTVLISSVKA